MKSLPRILLSLGVVTVLVLGYQFLRGRLIPGVRDASVIEFLRNPGDHPGWAVQAGQRCGQAPFSLPTSGFIGYRWGDSFRPGHRHQGLDIFGGEQAGRTPVVAAFDGYLTREADWVSTVIIRIPEDPLLPGRQIWTYYTHLADEAGKSLVDKTFPPGAREVFVKAGTLLGMQGNYSGEARNPVGVHLHFSIVRDNGEGAYLNELDIDNTLDPSPYFNLPLDGREDGDVLAVCAEESG